MKNLRVGIRILTGFAVVVAITLTLALFSINRAQNTGRQGERLQGNYLPSVISMYQIQSNLYQSVELLLRIIATSDRAEMARLNAKVADLRASSLKATDVYEATPTETQREKDVYAESKITRANFLNVYEEVRRIGSIGTDVENAHAQKVFDEQLKPLYEKYAGELAEIVEINHDGAISSMGSIQDSVHESLRGTIIGVLLCILVSVPIALWIARSVTSPLGEAVRALERVADNDLTVVLDVDRKDEIGQLGNALNTALANLKNTLQEVAEGSANAGSASQQLAAAADAIASGAQEQAASLEETSASLEEITATVRQSADNAKQASQLASGSKDAAAKGKAVVESAVTAMEEINAASAKISDIISTIDEIAFQTNLLAVNAAVEAARAGEQGRGFAVVASEVRSLAQRSAGAAKEIKGLIQDSLKKVEKGSELVNKSGETLQGIVSSVTRVTDIVGEIAAASEEQSTGVEQVNKAMTQMDQVTQSNAAQTEELSSTAQSLSDQALRLMELVGTFTLDQKTGRDNRPAARPTALKQTSVQIRIPIKPAKGKPASTSTHAVAARQVPVRTETVALTAVHGGGGKDDSNFEEF